MCVSLNICCTLIIVEGIFCLNWCIQQFMQNECAYVKCYCTFIVVRLHFRFRICKQPTDCAQSGGPGCSGHLLNTHLSIS